MLDALKVEFLNRIIFVPRQNYSVFRVHLCALGPLESSIVIKAELRCDILMRSKRDVWLQQHNSFFLAWIAEALNFLHQDA